MTFAVLRALHTIIADALDDIQRVYDPESLSGLRSPPVSAPKGDGKNSPYASPPPTPSTSTHFNPLDFPSLDVPHDPADPSELLTAHPTVVVAINRIVAAAGQMAAIVQTPFLSLCDSSMGYHLPSCMRLLEASHTIEILREAGTQGLHVDAISQQNGVESGKLAHVLRLLATHHIIRERAPNIFTMNRISSLLDSGKSVAQLRQWESEGRPEMKYHDTNGISAFVGLSTDELQKSAAYMTEAYLLSRAKSLRTPFEFAFGTDVGFFEWLEGEERHEKTVPKGNRSRHGSRDEHGIEIGLGAVGPAALGKTPTKSDLEDGNPNRYRLERFGKAMSGSVSWEVPAAVLNGFDWHALPRGSVIVDVGGGIGSTTMVLANAFSRGGSSYLSYDGDEEGLDLGFEFVIQDRQVVVEMGEKAWRSKCPELLDSGTVKFQVHDFFTTQPIKNAAVFFLRVILHDWPDSRARMILLKLREAATERTKLVLADFVLPLACADDVGPGTAGDGDAEALDGVEGAESILAPAPLLANLGKASANAYWMDLTMQVTFNAQERTLREIVTLALSAGWKVIKVTRGVGSLFGHIIAVPVPIPMQKRARAGSGSAFFDVPNNSTSGVVGARTENEVGREMEFVERAASRCGTPTFGSRMELPSVQETMARFGGGVARTRRPGLIGKAGGLTTRPGILRPSVVLTSPPVKKKKPSPLSFPPPLPSSPAPTSPLPPAPIAHRMSQANLYRPQSQQGPVSPVSAVSRQPPPSPMSPRHPPPKTLTRHASHAQLSHTSQIPPIPRSPPPPLPSSSRLPPPSSPHPRLPRRMSLAQLYQPAHGHSNSIPASPAVLRQIPALSHRSSRAQLSTASQSSIPIRQIQDHSPSLPTVPAPFQPPASPITSRHTPIARRSSYAQMPQGPLRKRSGSIISPSNSIRSGGIGGSISMASLLDGGGGVLKFKSYDDEGQDRRSPISANGGSGGNVLAAAAKIERGIPPVPPSP